MTLQRLFILTATFLTLACSPSSNSNKTVTPFIEGTSDSGGGNGIENKAYEAYIVKPENLPAYKNIVAPKVKNILSLAPIDADSALQLFQHWILYKTWYIAPVSLGTISKDVIGVSFSKDQTEQLAIQTKRSIWINSTRFQQMTQEDQATLIIHEMVMSLYYLKYKTWEEIDRERLLKPEPMMPEELDFLQELFPPTALKPFDSDDYENIRAVTAGFLGEVKFKSVDEVDALLFTKKFDPRFSFTMGLSPNGGSLVKLIYGTSSLPNVEFMKIVNFADLLGRTPTKCRGVKFQEELNCQFSTRLVDIKLKSGIQALENSLQIKSSDPKLPIEFAGITPMSPEYNAHTMEYVNLKKRISSFTLFTNPFPTLPIPGTSFYTVTVVFIEDLKEATPQLTLLGLIAVPGIVTGRDRNNPQNCTYSKPAASSIQTDKILAYSEHLTESEKTLLRATANTRQPFTTCVQY